MSMRGAERRASALPAAHICPARRATSENDMTKDQIRVAIMLIILGGLIGWAMHL
jgi:hypothetical protein